MCDSVKPIAVSMTSFDPSLITNPHQTHRQDDTGGMAKGKRNIALKSGNMSRRRNGVFEVIYQPRLGYASTAVMLAAGELIETWGIPQHILLDNGREFAAKAITGGSATRFRLKVREDVYSKRATSASRRACLFRRQISSAFSDLKKLSTAEVS